MSQKKPAPMVLTSPQPRLCPVCGVASYSRNGIHPQCAQRQADAPRMERLKTAEKAAQEKSASPNTLELNSWQKRCPKCMARLHARKIKCDCGHCFGEKALKRNPA